MPRQDSRTYITVHDGMPDHPKIVGLSDAAFRALISGWCWCSRYLTDGEMPVEVWSRICNNRVSQELARNANLYTKDDGKTIVFHDYLEHQLSRQQVADLRRKRAEAGRKGGQSRSKPQASAKQVLGTLLSKTEADIDIEEVRSTSVENERHLGNADVDPRIEDEPRSKPVDVSSMKLLRAYTDIVGLTDKGRACATITAARAHYSEDRIVAALDRMAHDKRTLTPDALRIEIEGGGKPKLPYGMTIDENGVTRTATGMPVAGKGWESY